MGRAGITGQRGQAYHYTRKKRVVDNDVIINTCRCNNWQRSRRKEQIMGKKCFDCSTCRYRYLHFPNMDDFEISMQECLCDGEDYEEEQ